MEGITRILGAIARSDPSAANELFPVAYDELRKLASRLLADERPHHTLHSTALVHEAYLRLAGGQAREAFENRAHFFSAAAEAMRRVLVDHARRRNAQRRGGGAARQSFDEALNAPASVDETAADFEELIAVHAALEALEAENPAAAELVKLRYFAGLSEADAATVLGISRATASRLWTYARAWLRHEIKKAISEGAKPGSPDS